MATLKDKTVRLGPAAYQSLRQLAEQTGESLPAVLDRAIEEYRRKRFLEGLNAGFAALRNDPSAWQEEQKERAAWDSTLADGSEGDVEPQKSAGYTEKNPEKPSLWWIEN